MNREPRQPVTFQYDFDKVLAALVYLAQPGRVKNLDKKKAISLLFLADKTHLLRYGRPIFGDYYRALEWGTVPQATLDRLDEFEKGTPAQDILKLAEALDRKRIHGHKYFIYVAKKQPDLDALSELELDALNEVIERYGKSTFEQLKQPVHPPAWEKAWANKPHGKNAGPMKYEDFFENEPGAADALEKMLESFQLGRALAGRS